MIENIINITTNDRLQRSVVHFISISSLIFSIESKSKWARHGMEQKFFRTT